MSNVIPAGYFVNKYNGTLKGKDWIRRIDPADRQALSREAFKASGYGVIGGIVRASTAKRDKNGRFVKG